MNSTSTRPVLLGAWLLCLLAAGARADIPSAHPRIWLTDAALTALRDRACLDAQGDPIAGCEADPAWTRLKGWADAHLDDDSLRADSAGYGLDALRIVNFAAVYRLTGDETYARAAIDKMLAFMDSTADFGSDEVSYVRAHTGYVIRYYPPSAALVLDWCHDRLTGEERARLVGSLDSIGQIVQSGDDGQGGTLWAYHDASNNYWYGHLWALTAIGYAIHGEQPDNQAESFLTYVTETMLPEALAETSGAELGWPHCMGNDYCELVSNSTGHTQGGEWSEGNSYGRVNTEMLAKTLLTLRQVEGVDRLADFSIFDAFIIKTLYSVLPGTDEYVIAGQGESAQFAPACSLPWILAMEAGCDSPASRYAAEAIAESGQAPGDCYSQSHKHYDFFIWTRPDHARADHRQALGLAHYTDGMRILTHRSDWSDQALWLQMRFNGHYSDHTHNGQGGHFSLFRDGWLIADHTKYMDNTDAYFNVVYLPPDADTQMWWDEPRIAHRSVTDDYLYFAADVSPVFLHASCGSRDWRHCNVERVERSLLFLAPSRHLLILDRIRTESAGDEKAWQIFFDGQPAIDGPVASYANARSRVFVKTLLPEQAVAQSDDFSCQGCEDWRYQVRAAEAQAELAFLHAIEVGLASAASMGRADLLRAEDELAVGALLDREVVLFALAEPASALRYAIPDGEREHVLCGMRPDTAYCLLGPGAPASARSDGEGVLRFATSGAGPVLATDDAEACDLCAGVECQPADECHLAGECDPASGSCSNPPAEDGTPCTGGTCRDGVCVPAQADGGDGGRPDGGGADGGAADAGDGGGPTTGGCSCSSTARGQLLAWLLLGLAFAARLRGRQGSALQPRGRISWKQR
ncbi:MAG: hypothetical protein JXR96_27795 [Deltaproteobacteria bacterium]|nr:hypothetical protein [Deltaproteobacteria bacterium]